jgi:AraC-like DNA-binding protein
MHIIYIKNMVCPRCITTVQDILEKYSIPFKEVKLGEVKTLETISTEQLEILTHSLAKVGFTILDGKKATLVSQIKTRLVSVIYHDNNNIKVNYSELLAKELGHEYSYLSHLFPSIENTTIEKFIIQLKIERVKELLVYNELSLNQIAYKLSYSSVQALSSQFKKVTGFTPSYFKQLKEDKRIPLDKLTS